MTPIETLLDRLSGARKVGNGWSARCPAHDDRRASLSVTESDDGTVLVKCHAGCSATAIVSAVGLTLADLFPPSAASMPNRNGKPKSGSRPFPTAKAAVAELERRNGKRSAIWTYHDAQGERVGVVVRWDRPDGKDIRPVARHADGWRISAMPEPRPLYGLPQLAQAQRVLVVEGEKAADAARSIGFIATTSASGAEAAAKTDWRPLAGKEVLIFPDNDAPGRKYADTVAGILAILTPAPAVKIIELPGLPESGDIADWIDTHGDAAEPDGLRAKIETLAQTVEPWRNMDAKDVTFRPFPIDALPEPIRDFVTATAKAIGCDPVFVVLPLLAALASAIGNTRCIRLKPDWLEPCILWAVVIAESGAKKSPPIDAAMRPLYKMQHEAMKRFAQKLKEYKQAHKEYERELARWKRAKGAGHPPEEPEAPVCERCWIDDTTVEAVLPLLAQNWRGLLMKRDELSSWFGSFDKYSKGSKASGDAGKWIEMFGGRPIVNDRKTSGTQYVPRAALSVTGGIQPGVFRRALEQENRENGLLARLLTAMPPTKVRKWSEATVAPRLIHALQSLFAKLFALEPGRDEDGDPVPLALPMTPDGRIAWIEFYNAHADEQAELSGDLSAAWSKLEGYAARLALVVHLVRWAAGDPTLTAADQVDAASIAAGVKLSRWFGNEARRVYAMLDESDAERDQRQLVEWIARKGGSVTPREVQMGCRSLREPGAAEAALDALVKAGRGAWRDVPTTDKGGRPARTFTLVNAVNVNETPTKPEENEGFVDVDTVDTSAQAPCDDWGEI
jgi:hypothetical protein